MNRNRWIAMAIAVLVIAFIIWGNRKEKDPHQASREDVRVVTAQGSYGSELQPDVENYRFEREQLAQLPDINRARVKPEFKGAPEFRASPLMGKVSAGPVDDYGAPLFIPSEVAMTDGKIFEQELAKHRERSDAYAAARMDELKLNTEAEKNAIRAAIDQARADGSKSPEELRRAEDAYARMEQLQKVLNGEKVDVRLE